MKVASYAVVLAALWLLGAPSILTYRDRLMTVDDIAVGLALWAAGMFAAANEAVPLHWVIIALGAWLIIAPWVLGRVNVSSAVTNDASIGAAVVILGLIRWIAVKTHDQMARKV